MKGPIQHGSRDVVFRMGWRDGRGVAVERNVRGVLRLHADVNTMTLIECGLKTEQRSLARRPGCSANPVGEGTSPSGMGGGGEGRYTVFTYHPGSWLNSARLPGPGTF